MNTETNNFKLGQIIALSNHMADIHKWLSACPLNDAQAVYETVGTDLRELEKAVQHYAQLQEDHALHETIAAAVEEGEYDDLDSDLFWRMVAKMAQGRLTD